MITLGLVDDEPLFTAGLRMILDAQPDMRVLWQAIDGADAIRCHDRSFPDVVLADIQMPTLDGVAATQRLVASGASSRIIILTTFDTDEHVLAAIEAGASGFLLKNTAPDDLIAAIRTVHDGDSVISPGPTRRLFGRFRTGSGKAVPSPSPAERSLLEQITPREREILALVATGRTNQEICDELWITMPTIKTHIGSLRMKIRARDRVQLALFALRHGMAELE